ncbi:DUF3553 domain-containing protein [Roseovarius spongiae]|uniref:DUF3553 domain-containing protein n=1 Tax=Roseovarius spongiae TaxID=2320272 RepID=A0A3A8B6T9_9RHOB|nr:DUF3553 domain-containing protein [Roseovarius spongiae]RKF17025.1 DUF3553 domain-containing protein [Roseovarius spongiae]
MTDMSAFLEPGMRVEHPGQPDWGVGQVQSNIAGKVTVNFPEAGKVVIDATRIALIPVIDP